MTHTHMHSDVVVIEFISVLCIGKYKIIMVWQHGVKMPPFHSIHMYTLNQNVLMM